MYGRIRPSQQRIVKRSIHDGFTLIEIVLVLALLLTITAIAWPSLNRLYQRHRIKQAAVQVQMALGAARIHALETGLTYQFRYEPAGRKSVVVALPADELAFAATTTAASWKSMGDLPQDIRFQTLRSETRTDGVLTGEFLHGLNLPAEFKDVAWAPPLLFYPDGTATDGEVAIVDEDQQMVTLTVRGLTGAAARSAIQRGAQP